MRARRSDRFQAPAITPLDLHSLESSDLAGLLGGKHPKRGKATLLRSHTEGLSNPSLRGVALLYVRNTRRADRLKLTGAAGHGPGRTLLSRRRGTLWSTALSDQRAYVTLIQGTRPRQRFLSVAR